MTRLRNDIYIAHIRESDGAIQTVREHSLETAELAASFAIGLFGKIAYFAAILHDIGKYRPGFQKKISGENPNIRVEHSICGAMVVNEMYKEKRFAPLALLTKLCIAGHHSGIPDCGLSTDDENPEESTLYARLAREIPLSEYHAYQSDINIPEIDPGPFNELLTQDLTNDEHGRITFINKFAFFTRYIFSCLADADSLDTAVFCSEKEEDRSVYADFRECLQKIDAEFAKFAAITALQKTRGKLQQIVYEKIHQSAEIFFMNMPTGSGKTLCSMKFALERAIRGDKKRIIYVIPYNSIIDQTAQIFSNLFGESAFVLRHQSTFSYDNREDLDEDYRKTIRYATENWDAQIIITTVVQFFESVYGNKRGQLRKLHNIADSILIFDEAHILPVDYMQPCLEAIAFITKYLNSEAILLTATMPDYQRMFKEYALRNSRMVDLVDVKTAEADFEVFNKCSYQNLDDLSQEALIQHAIQQPTSLIIVNKRKTALELYHGLPGNKVHLSTYMTPYDREQKIVEIKEKLRSLNERYPDPLLIPEDERLVVVSTSLIEAGVDLDFYAVYRQIAGLDHILQAGGRCNREGKRSKGDVFIFQLESEKDIVSDDDGKKSVTYDLIRSYSEITDPECIKEYYDRVFYLQREKVIANTLYKKYNVGKIDNIPFRKYTENFRIINDHTFSIVVSRNDESEKLIDQLKYTGRCSTRKLQRYSFSVYRWELEDLMEQNVVENFGSAVWVLTNKDYYDPDTGVKFEASDYIQEDGGNFNGIWI